jgi:uncharacterized phosphosugar-binding protein
MGTRERLLLVVKRATNQAMGVIVGDPRLHNKKTMAEFMEPMLARGMTIVALTRVAVSDDAFAAEDAGKMVRERSDGVFDLRVRDGWAYLMLTGVPESMQHTWTPLDVLMADVEVTAGPCFGCRVGLLQPRPPDFA